jgi:hypothetical protein
VRLVQLELESGERRVAVVAGDALRVLADTTSVYELASQAIREQVSLSNLVERVEVLHELDYRAVIAEGRLHSPLDHPDPARLLVSGTGLTHLGSAATRAEMHQASEATHPLGETDSMKLFRLGLDQGKPSDGSVGVQPEWFYKGNGHCLARPGHALVVPDFSLDAGEEPEIVGLYLVSAAGQPYRVGFALGNELSDHVTERQNYLYLAHSKLRPCSVGPELLLGELPERVSGHSRIERQGQVLWQSSFRSGEANMSHRIAGLEHHHFKYPMFRQPGSVHVHFFGTATLSFAAGVRTRSGDVFEIESDTFGQPLRNVLKHEPAHVPEVRVL